MFKIKPIIRKLLPDNIYQKIRKYKRTMSPRQVMLRNPDLFFFVKQYLYPKVLSIFLTTKCNLRCFICRREDFKTSELDFENLKKLERAIKYSKITEFTGWGEAMVYPDFKKAVNYVYSLKKHALIQFTTNGTLLNSEIGKLLKGHINYIGISLNAATEESYNRDMKGGNFERTTSRIKDFMSALDKEERNKINLILIAHTENFREIPEFVRLAKELSVQRVSIGNYYVGIKDHIKYSLLNVKEEYNNTITHAEKTAEELDIRFSAKKFFQEEIKEKMEFLCIDPYDYCYIKTNGEVSPCCYCGNSISMGNVYENSFESIWFGKKYIQLRKKRLLPACKGCNAYAALDDYNSHFSMDFRETEEFKNFEKNFKG